MKLTMNVRGKEKEVLSTFHTTIDYRQTKDFQLDHETFYRKYNEGKLHDQTFEIAINTTTPFSIEDMVAKKAHLHQGNDQKHYICYPAEIKTASQAFELTVIWTLITTFHMQFQADIGYFEWFGNWLLKKAKTHQDLNSFEEFPLWISEEMGWKVEILESNALKDIVSLCQKKLFDTLIQKSDKQ